MFCSVQPNAATLVMKGYSVLKMWLVRQRTKLFNLNLNNHMWLVVTLSAQLLEICHQSVVWESAALASPTAFLLEMQNHRSTNRICILTRFSGDLHTHRNL